MNLRLTRALAPAALATALLLTGCASGDGNAKKDTAVTPSSTAVTPSSTAPTPSADAAQTITVNHQEAAILDTGAGAEVTVVEDLSEVEGVEEATDPPAETSAASDLAETVAQANGIKQDQAAADAIDYVTVVSSDGQFSMDVPSDWAYASYVNDFGGQVFGGSDGLFGTRSTAKAETVQRVLSGDYAHSPKTNLELLQSETSQVAQDVAGCTAGVPSDYQAAQLNGLANTYACNGFSIVYLVGQVPGVATTRYFVLTVKDGAGLAMLERALSSFQPTA